MGKEKNGIGHVPLSLASTCGIDNLPPWAVLWHNFSIKIDFRYLWEHVEVGKVKKTTRKTISQSCAWSDTVKERM
jgi:hypothetical protein